MFCNHIMLSLVLPSFIVLHARWIERIYFCSCSLAQLQLADFGFYAKKNNDRGVYHFWGLDIWALLLFFLFFHKSTKVWCKVVNVTNTETTALCCHHISSLHASTQHANTKLAKNTPAQQSEPDVAAMDFSFLPVHVFKVQQSQKTLKSFWAAFSLCCQFSVQT